MSDVLMPEQSDTPPPSDDGRRRRLAPYLALAAAVVLAAFIVVAIVAKGGTKDSAATPLLGQPAPIVQTTTTDGQPFDLATRRGSWVVLNFFSTWCQPCVAEHPELVRFAQSQGGQPDGAELVSVVFNDDVGAVKKFFAEHGGGWPALNDTDGRIQVGFGVAKSPETWVVDPDGVVRARIISQVTSAELNELLARLKAGTPASS
jgi:cytochrome c biogenesis protein CcmG/thiol:disulfide interchange protein DsbE